MGIREHHEVKNLEVPLSVKIAALMKETSTDNGTAEFIKRVSELFDLKDEILSPLIDRALQQSAELSEALS